MSFLSLSLLKDSQPLFTATYVPKIWAHSYTQRRRIYQIFYSINKKINCRPFKIYPISNFPKKYLPDKNFFIKVALEILKKRYPALEYFQEIEGVDCDALHILANEIHLDAKSMSAECKKILKMIRQFASNAEQKLKKGRKLYKFLQSQTDQLNQIIINGGKIKSLDALDRKKYINLTELQLSNNQIQDLSSLSTLDAPSLQNIDLSSNSISFIGSLNYCSWSQLITLQLSQNRITSLQCIHFNKFESLKYLNLSDNFLIQIKSIRKQFSGGLKHLKTLDLSNNFIISIQSLSECKFHGLTVLNLQNNNNSEFFSIQKIAMNPKGIGINYQIKVTSFWNRQKYFIFNYRKKSKHRLSVKIQKSSPKINRQWIQAKRKIILD